MQVLGHGGVVGVVAVVQLLVARAALDPAVGLFAVDLGQHALLGGELFIELAGQFVAEVHVAGARLQNAELAKQRALGVRDALKVLGVAEDKVELKKPEVTQGSGSNAEARRVEVTLAAQ